MAFCSTCGTQQTESGVCPTCNPEAVQLQPPAEQQPVAPPPPPPVQPVAPPPPPPAQQYSQPPQQQYAPPPPQYGAPPPYPQAAPIPHYAPGSFADLLHSFGGSVLFLVGICLFTAGGLIPIFMNFHVWSIFDMGILALPVTGFFLIFAASKMPKLPEKTLTALKLFKVSIIITLVVVSLVALLGLIVGLIIFTLASEIGGGATLVGLIALLVAAGAVVFIIIYFKAVLKILTALRNGITYNSFAPIPELGRFTILTYIMVGFAVLSSVVIIASMSFAHNLLYNLPDFFADILRSAIPSQSTMALDMIMTLAYNAGIVIPIVVLNQLNARLTGNQNNQPQ